jgi:hypothetical protein
MEVLIENDRNISKHMGKPSVNVKSVGKSSEKNNTCLKRHGKTQWNIFRKSAKL